MSEQSDFIPVGSVYGTLFYVLTDKLNQGKHAFTKVQMAMNEPLEKKHMETKVKCLLAEVHYLKKKAKIIARPLEAKVELLEAKIRMLEGKDAVVPYNHNQDETTHQEDPSVPRGESGDGDQEGIPEDEEQAEAS